MRRRHPACCPIFRCNPRGPIMTRPWNALVLILSIAAAPADAQRAVDVPPGHTCTAITQANADASAGTVNIHHDGTPIDGIPAPDISRGFAGIPRSAAPADAVAAADS